ncbi:DNA mismatch repair protein [Bradyrhizobium elkanii USDA 61]|nr:DNA mismatch repair protein [Bradyrhizobium elkanii USDA 61]
MPVRQLPEQLVNRIAAGEVVERPASVVKELVENAIDAGASRIDVFTDGGGRRRIGITDDGGGMTRADLALAVDRHATSKLDDEDLLRIRTLGFRGEALPSIGAVAKLGITTRHASEPHAWSLSVEGGEKSEVMPAALGQGTRVEVNDLFYATPARLKFLKTDRTEAEAIREVVRRLGMARPDIAFTLAGEERAPVTWAAALPGAAGRLTRLGDILGADFRASAIEVRAEREGVVVEGFAAAPSLTRANALGQYLFVNGRPVRDKLILGAVRAAYSDYLPRDRHPVVALFVTCDPQEVDANVHPAKTEVRFRNAGLVRALIVHALKEGLAREGRRTAANTADGTALSAFRPAFTPPRPGNWDWRGSPSYPTGPMRAFDGAAAPAFAEPGQFQHVLERDLVEPARLRHHAGVGGVDAVDVGVDVAAVGAQRGRDRHRRGVRAAAAERGDAAAVGIDALEAGDHGDFLALLEAGDDLGAVDIEDARRSVRVRGLDRDLPALPGARLDADALQHDREQARGDLFAGGDHRVIFARVVHRRGVGAPGHQLIGLAGHRGDDDGDLVARVDLALHMLRDVADTIDIGDGCTAEFHHEAAHDDASIPLRG